MHPCTTLLPLCFSYECSNPVYGVTHNPHDVSRSPGGSSGGEGALLGAGGSILGKSISMCTRTSKTSYNLVKLVC